MSHAKRKAIFLTQISDPCHYFRWTQKNPRNEYWWTPHQEVPLTAKGSLDTKKPTQNQQKTHIPHPSLGMVAILQCSGRHRRESCAPALRSREIAVDCWAPVAGDLRPRPQQDFIMYVRLTSYAKKRNVLEISRVTRFFFSIFQYILKHFLPLWKRLKSIIQCVEAYHKRNCGLHFCCLFCQMHQVCKSVKSVTDDNIATRSNSLPCGQRVNYFFLSLYYLSAPQEGIINMLLVYFLTDVQ